MPTTLIPIIFSLVEEAIKIEPGIQADLTSLFTKAAVTPDDWTALRNKWAADTYASHVPDSGIPPGT